MKTKFWQIWLYELKILPPLSYLLLAVALGLLALTHGALELAQNWPKHFVENMESFVPTAVALISAPMLVADGEQGMLEVSATLPHKRIAQVRWLVVWGASWAAILAGAEIMNIIWGPVAFWTGVAAALGPALFLSGLAIWASVLTARLVLGYLVAVGLAAADLILRVLGAFNAVPALQFLDVFAYRWNIAAVSWKWVVLFMGIAGLCLIQCAIQTAERFWRRSL